MPHQNNEVIEITKNIVLYHEECPWIEFKVNYVDPDAIGEYISALSNSAALFGKQRAYMIWGIDDSDKAIRGTDFDPLHKKIGNQDLSLWLSTQLDPDVPFYFHKVKMDDKEVVLLEIFATIQSPVRFKSEDFIRIESSKKKLKDYPNTERALWSALSKQSFETISSLEMTTKDNVLRLIDCAAYFDLHNLEYPTNEDSMIETLVAEGLITKTYHNAYSITNFGAVLFARKLSEFPSLTRKAVRVIRYDGTGRQSASKEYVFDIGYAHGFERLLEFVNALIPTNEIMGQALRKDMPMYPELAVRELIANAMIHQDFLVQGSSLTIEIFDNRMEITNPGTPLIEINRFVDHPPISRNEKLASLMRRIGICEERGSGFDKVVFETEYYQLPAPEIEVYDNHTKVTLYSHKTYSEMSKEDRLRACYLHACLKRVNREFLTNSSLRERFNIESKNSSMISRLLKDACDSGWIKLAEEFSGDKNRRYVPFWA